MRVHWYWQGKAACGRAGRHAQISTELGQVTCTECRAHHDRPDPIDVATSEALRAAAQGFRSVLNPKSGA